MQNLIYKINLQKKLLDKYEDADCGDRGKTGERNYQYSHDQEIKRTCKHYYFVYLGEEAN